MEAYTLLLQAEDRPRPTTHHPKTSDSTEELQALVRIPGENSAEHLIDSETWNSKEKDPGVQSC
jgi:hypothetical protein